MQTIRLNFCHSETEFYSIYLYMYLESGRKTVKIVRYIPSSSPGGGLFVSPRPDIAASSLEKYFFPFLRILERTVQYLKEKNASKINFDYEAIGENKRKLYVEDNVVTYWVELRPKDEAEYLREILGEQIMICAIDYYAKHHLLQLETSTENDQAPT